MTTEAEDLAARLRTILREASLNADEVAALDRAAAVIAATKEAPDTADVQALADLRYTVHGGAHLPDGVHRVGYVAAKAILDAGYRPAGFSHTPEDRGDDESGQRSGECEHGDHEDCDGTTPGWECECSCHAAVRDAPEDRVEREATSDEAFDIGWVQGYEAARAELGAPSGFVGATPPAARDIPEDRAEGN